MDRGDGEARRIGDTVRGRRGASASAAGGRADIHSSYYVTHPRQARDAASRGYVIVKKEARHFIAGARLLAADVKIGSGLIRRMLQGHTLTTRERRQLVRTSVDMMRMVPFVTLLAIPGGEFFLPVILKVSPNFLPSQFKSERAKEDRARKELAVSIGMARFLQETLEELSDDRQRRAEAGNSPEKATAAAEFHNFIARVRSGEAVQDEDIMKFAPLFEDEMTLENIERSQLIALTRFLGLSSYGNSTFLRHQLSRRVEEIRRDDRAILAEGGIGALSRAELETANRERGMRAVGVDTPTLRTSLQDWIHWSQERQMPSVLLLMSRALTITNADQYTHASTTTLGDALSSLPDHIVDEVSSEIESDESERRVKALEVLQQQQELIEEEREEAQEAADAGVVSVPSEATLKKDLNIAEDLWDRVESLADAVSHLSGADMARERERLDELRTEQAELRKLAMDIPSVQGWRKQTRDNVSDATEHLVASRVDALIAKIDYQIAKMESVVELDRDRDGVISTQELQEAAQALQEPPSPEELQRIVDQLDTDRDGRISVEDIVKAGDAAEILSDEKEAEQKSKAAKRASKE